MQGQEIDSGGQLLFEVKANTSEVDVIDLHVGREYPVTDAAEEAEVQQKTAIDVYQLLCEVCSTRLIADGRVVLGGRGSIVQIDESLFRHKPSYRELHKLVKKSTSYSWD